MVHYNTVFHTLAKIFPRHGIDRLDRKYGQGDKRRKSSRYVQFIVMLMAQILGLKSLREIEQAQKSKQKRLYHLGVKSPVSRSALSRMNLVDAPQKWRILQCSSYQETARLAMWIRNGQRDEKRTIDRHIIRRKRIKILQWYGGKATKQAEYE